MIVVNCALKSIDDANFRLASIVDIGCMKLSAITSRATNKDYIDLYFILKKISLKKLLLASSRKFKELDQNLILKSLVYFDDIEKTPILFKNSNRVSEKEYKDYLIKEVRDFGILNT